MPNALISVYRKEGMVEFARELVNLGWQLLASAGTAKAIAAAGLPVRDVAELVGPPILGHRVVTLSREIHAGLLATEEQRPELERLGIPWIDLVCVDLYRLSDEITRQGSTPESVRELTDIGGPTLLRSAAKSGRIVISDPADRAEVLRWIRDGDPAERHTFITQLAAKAEATVAEYCLTSATYHGQGQYAGMVGVRERPLAYGENSWQGEAALYSCSTSDPLALDRFTIVEGAVPSHNNCCDLDRALQTVTHIAAACDANQREVPCIAIGIKHGNACGAGVAPAPIEAVARMLAGNPRSIMGGLVMVNFSLSETTAEMLNHYLLQADDRRILDGVVAPNFSPGAVALLSRKRGKCRLFANPALAELSAFSLDPALRFRYVRGGFLAQGNYTHVLDLHDPALVWHGEPTAAQRRDLLLAWAVGATSNSNTVTIVKDDQLIGNGVGQQDRVEAADLAVRRARSAGHDTQGAVAYSDSFFPFPDGPQVLIDAGVSAVLTTSGSVNDESVIKTFRDAGVVLGMIPDQLGRGFFGH